MRKRGQAGIGFAAGVLSTNALPHLAAASAGKRMLTPLAGAESSPAVNLVWAGMNLAVGLLLSRFPRTDSAGWSARSAGFAVGSVVFATWAVIYETVARRRARR